MNGEVKPGMQCAEFEAMLAEAVEGRLSDEARPAFSAHRGSCPACASLCAEAESGWRWLKELQGEEVEPPPYLVDNILRATSRAIPAGAEARRSWWQRLRELPVLGPVLPAVLQPRLALSFAMVFVSVAATISLAGPSLRHVRYAELRPSALRHDFYEAQGKVVKYYENIRFVYELESRIRAVRREVESPDTQPQSEPRKEIKDEPGNGRTSSLPTELSSVAGYPSRANGQRPASNEVPADFDFHGESNELCPTC